MMVYISTHIFRELFIIMKPYDFCHWWMFCAFSFVSLVLYRATEVTEVLNAFMFFCQKG